MSKRGNTKTTPAAAGRETGRKAQRSEGDMISLRDLLIHEMQDLYDAEKQLLKALPKVAESATSTDLQEAIRGHLKQTQEHVQRLEQSFKQLGENAKGTHCDAMEGLLEEGEKMMKEEGDAPVIDAGIIAAAQKVEHYEIASYGCVCTWAESLGESEVGELLSQTLAEEKEADEKLTEIAESNVNEQAKTE